MPFPYTSYARTCHQIVLETFRLCGDVILHSEQAYGRIWTYDEVQDRVNRAILYAIDMTGGLRGSAVVTVTADSDVYDLPLDCIRPLRINFSGIDGWVLLPKSITNEVDLVECRRIAKGFPYDFFREYLGPNQIGVIPTPQATGSTFTRDSTHGLLRGIRDADGHYLPYDANAPLRQIRGVPFQRTGDGRIIREVISPFGNIHVYYVRSPAKMTERDHYPDTGIPEWFHKDIKYGAATLLLQFRRDKVSQLRLKRCQKMWLKANFRLQKLIQTTGPMDYETRPI